MRVHIVDSVWHLDKHKPDVEVKEGQIFRPPGTKEDK
jgi:hypothetical protein